MTILITGVNGFIGKHLTSYILAQHQDTMVFGISRSQQIHFHPNYNHIQGDLSKKDFLNNLPDNIDIIVHLAQSREYRNFPSGASDLYAVNIQSIFFLLEYARLKKVKKFLFTSTGNVYKQKETALTETDLVEPGSFYASTKFIAEQLISNYSNFFETKIFRLFTVYGPGQKDMLIVNLIKKIKAEEPIKLASGKGIFINPIFIDDCIQFLYTGIFSNTKDIPNILNIAGEEILSLEEIIQYIEKIECIKPLRINESSKPTYLIGDNSQLKSAFPKSSFETFKSGILKTINAVHE